MDRVRLQKKNLPDEPGVYYFLGESSKSTGTHKGRRILYIGKATSLRDRVRSYFGGDLSAARGQRIRQMVGEAEDIAYQTTDSVIEALVLEAHLIKAHQPPYNAREKDNKSFNYVVITDEDYPRVLVARGRELARIQAEEGTEKRRATVSRSRSVSAILRQTPIKKTFGPFTSGGSLQEALKIIRRIFPYRDRKCTPADDQRGIGTPKPCFNRQIGLCPGVCTGEITKREYQRYIRNIILFFEGKKKALLKNLEREMVSAAKEQAFERAGEIKRRIDGLTHLSDTALLTRDFLSDEITRDRKLIDRVEAYDVAHLAGNAHLGVMTVLEDGQPATDEYRVFNIRTRTKADDIGALREVLSRRLNHTEWQYPKLIVVDGARAQKNAAEYILSEFGITIPVVAVRKNERHKPQEIIGSSKYIHKHEQTILLANSEAHRFALAKHRLKLRKR